MNTYLIHLPNIKTSLDSALETKEQLEKIGINPIMFTGSFGPNIELLFAEQKRTIRNIENFNSTSPIKIHGPGAKGVFHSHYRLWNICLELNEPIMIFEDDVKIYRPYTPIEFDEVLVLSLNYDWKMTFKYRKYLEENNDLTVPIEYRHPYMPGTSGYIIKPKAARKLVDYYDTTNTFIISDIAMSSDLINIEIHPQLIGRSKMVNEKKSLVRMHLEEWNSL
jgi:GR25 family glycosyltransferase involved in LPS biosynthesis